MEPETIIAINEEPYRELQNDNDQGQRNAATLSNIAHFYISIIDQKNTTIFWLSRDELVYLINIKTSK